MFETKSETLNHLAEKFPKRIKELENIFNKKTNIYIDYANTLSWSDRLHFNIDLKRFYKFFRSFKNVDKIYFYYWTLDWNEKSEKLIKDALEYWYDVKTKPVKIMKKSIDTTSIDPSSTAILDNFIRKSLLIELKVSTIEYLNEKLWELNKQWLKFIEDRKCNFDVEIWIQMHEDMRNWNIENFILLSWDSDFYDIIEQLNVNSNKIFIFSTAWKISRELNDSSAIVYDLKKIKNFICWKKQMDQDL